MFPYFQFVFMLFGHLAQRAQCINITCDYLNNSNSLNSSTYILKEYSSISDIEFSCSYKLGLKLDFPFGFSLYLRSSKSIIFNFM